MCWACLMGVPRAYQGDANQSSTGVVSFENRAECLNRPTENDAYTIFTCLTNGNYEGFQIAVGYKNEMFYRRKWGINNWLGWKKV